MPDRLRILDTPYVDPGNQRKVGGAPHRVLADYRRYRPSAYRIPTARNRRMSDRSAAVCRHGLLPGDEQTAGLLDRGRRAAVI